MVHRVGLASSFVNRLAAMWCSTCQQDVPGLGSPLAGGLRCTKCSQPLIADAAPLVDVNGDALKRLLDDQPEADDWALEAELRGMERMLGSLRNNRPWADRPIA